jgi:hypothetical protein
MYNPLLPDVSKLKDQELESKILDLNKKYFIAARNGHGAICEQILAALETFKFEQQKRHFEATQKLIKKQDKDLDELINVN